jgi:hypothetical protein
MNHSFKKFVAVLLLLWFPLFSGNTLAAMVSMAIQPGTCHETARPTMMGPQDTAEQYHHHQHELTSGTADEENSSCSSCGVCHLFCAGYLLVPNIALDIAQSASTETVPNLVSFRSITFAPPLPPPLARV